MSNSTTEQKATSQDKSIIQGIGFKEFSSICQEYQIVEKATKELLEIAKDDDTPVRTKVDIYKWVIEMNVGKPRQITTELDDKLTELKVKKAKNETGNIVDMFS
jgi:predicted metal-dependent peptidase